MKFISRVFALILNLKLERKEKKKKSFSGCLFFFPARLLFGLSPAVGLGLLFHLGRAPASAHSRAPASTSKTPPPTLPSPVPLPCGPRLSGPSSSFGLTPSQTQTRVGRRLPIQIQVIPNPRASRKLPNQSPRPPLSLTGLIHKNCAFKRGNRARIWPHRRRTLLGLARPTRASPPIYVRPYASPEAPHNFSPAHRRVPEPVAPSPRNSDHPK